MDLASTFFWESSWGISSSHLQVRQHKQRQTVCCVEHQTFTLIWNRSGGKHLRSNG
jgi:hypothetical protein